ncbi:MAG: thioredoxin [Synergistaceae bacterium]|nr:thioredoxin [Synergistaceae bacterium]MBQ7069438.1 thioredoxin [Synergistaceae bacterium]MBR0232979.1 thioredoxin [Synergistaceae bacterium]MBR0315435.1 thioredoxin [Synergistaceae bacterium]
MAVKEIINSDTTELEASKIALLDIWATWCGPCKAIAPVVESLSEEYAGKVDFFKADADENPDLAKKFRVMSIPNLILFKDGKVAARHVGFQTADELKSWFESNM